MPTCSTCQRNTNKLLKRNPPTCGACHQRMLRANKGKTRPPATCLNCGSTINNKGTKRKYCHNKCKDEYYNRNNPEKVREKQARYRKKSGRSETSYVEGMKNKCKECGNLFSPDKFHPSQPYCGSACRQKVQNRNYMQRHPERTKEIQKKYYYSEHGQAKIKEKRERPQSKEAIRRWQKNNPEKVKEIQRRFKQSPQGRLSNKIRLHSKRALTEERFNKEELSKVMKSTNDTCELCNRNIGSKLQIGHILPLSKYRQLASDVNNVYPICINCNSQMRDWLFVDYCRKKNIPIPPRVLAYHELHKNDAPSKVQKKRHSKQIVPV